MFQSFLAKVVFSQTKPFDFAFGSTFHDICNIVRGQRAIAQNKLFKFVAETLSQSLEQKTSTIDRTHTPITARRIGLGDATRCWRCCWTRQCVSAQVDCSDRSRHVQEKTDMFPTKCGEPIVLQGYLFHHA